MTTDQRMPAYDVGIGPRMPCVQLVPVQHVVVRTHSDGSAILGVYGPVADLKAAEQLKEHLLNLGLGMYDNLEPMPIHLVGYASVAAVTPAESPEGDT